MPLDFKVPESGEVRSKVTAVYAAVTEASLVGREAFNASSENNPLEILPKSFDVKAEEFKQKLKRIFISSK